MLAMDSAMAVTVVTRRWLSEDVGDGDVCTGMPLIF
jgi:hypothetical protein